MSNNYKFSQEKLAFLRTKQIYDPVEGTWTRTDGRNRQRRKTTGALKYKMVNVDGILYYGHILAYWFMKGEPVPDGYEIDHKDRDGWNCRWDNLRLVTSSGNKLNMKIRSSNRSGFRGVYTIVNGKYNAVLTVEKVVHYLGTHETYESAVAARIAAEIEYLGKPLDEIHAELCVEGSGIVSTDQEPPCP